MMRARSILAAASLLVGTQFGFSAEKTDGAADFREVYDLVKSHLAGATDEDLNRAAVQGFVAALKPRVLLITNMQNSTSVTSAPVVIKSNLFEGNIGYIRVGRVAEGLSSNVRQAYETMGTTNKLKGLVLDLRFANGEDYAAAAAVADLFVRKHQQLLKWGSGSAQSKEKSNPITIPVAALVNGETRAAAEALAAVLRQTGAGLILGMRTSGQAMVASDFPLKNGDQLRIATARIEVGDTMTLSPEGLKPDIQVQVNPDDERAYYADAFTVIQSPQLMADATLSLTNQGQLSSTNKTRRPRFNEAELVRERKEGVNLDQDAGNDKEPDQDKPMVHDPVLARALDLLKGLAVVRHSAS
jgi:C-terminal processing protease CtpA/Prc